MRQDVVGQLTRLQEACRKFNEFERARPMKEKILKALKEKGHGMIPTALLMEIDPMRPDAAYVISGRQFYDLVSQMEQDKLLILHRADGSAGTRKGVIVLVCLRPEGH